jgi:autotransporter-associated beta strand protein
MNHRLAILVFSGLCIALAAFGQPGPSLLENLGRGVIAVRASTTEVFVSWRLLGTDAGDAAFNLYRTAGGGAAVKLNATPLSGPTHFTDTTADFAQSNAYFVRAVVFGVEQSPSASFTLPANAPVQQYLRVPLVRPPGGNTPANSNNPHGFTYNPNDTNVGDLDGDGEYELVLKWEPSDALDSSSDGFTGNTLIEAYKLDGTRLWQIDLGVNVRAGPHDVPFFVYDLDGDGRAEVFMRTAEGSRDGLGNFVADPAKFQGPLPSVIDHAADRRGYPSNGRALVGPEFLTIFNGLTGAELVSTRYEPARHPDTDFPTPQQLNDIWGDTFGNRQGRHYSPGVAYLDGQRPSIVMGRGYAGGQGGHPGRVALAAWNFRDGVLTPLWQVATGGGAGGHSSVVADLNGDGFDDIVYGQVWVRHDGTLFERANWGHGDALHVSQMDPDKPGQMVFMPHESPASYGPNGLSVDYGPTGALVAGVQAGGDIGRGVAADIDPRFRGYEFWGPGATPGLYNVQHVTANALLGPRAVQVAPTKPSSINFAIWWDGDLLRELLDNVSIRKWDWNAGAEVPVLAPAGILTNNGTKATPNLQADLFGDWREEAIWRETNNDALRIYTTTNPTSHRLYTLMHDRQYREAVNSQNVGYNQPPHPSFYLGDGMAPPPVPNIVTSLETLLGPPAPVFTGIVTDAGISSTDQITNDATLVLVGTAQANTTITITRFGTGVVGTTSADGAGNWTFDYTGTALPQGDSFFSATATDAQNRTGAPTNPVFRVTIDLTPPAAPVITDVAQENGTFVFLGTAEPGSVVTVIANGSNELGSSVANTSGNWSFTYQGPPLGSGAHAFTAKAQDTAGNDGAASAPFNVDTSVPPPVITAITEDTGFSASDRITSDRTLVLTGTGPAGATISVRLIGGSVIGTTTANGEGAWSLDYTSTSLSDGTYPFSAIATVGSSSSASSPAFLVTVDSVAPTVVSVNRQSPSAAASTSATITFRVTFSEPVAGAIASDFTPAFSGGLSGTIVTVAAAGAASFDVTLDLAGEGAVRLDIDAGGIKDPAGNALAAAFTTGQTYTRSLTGNGVWIRATSDGLWSANTNWQEGIVASGIGNTGDFSTLEIEGSIAVHLDSPRTVSNLIFGDSDIASPGTWLIDNNGNAANVLTLAVAGGSPTITVNPLGVGAVAQLDVTIAGTAGLTKLGTGTLVLTQPNTFTGTTSIGAGVIRIPAGGSASASAVNISSGGAQLNLTGGDFTATGTLTVNAGGGSALVIDSGTGTFGTLATNNSPGGIIRINGGTLTATSINFPRTNDNNLNFGSGFIVAGGTATISGVIGLGTSNSNGVMSIEGGTLFANGPIHVGDLGSNSSRGGIMRVISGTLVSTDTAEGIALVRRNSNTSVANFDGGTTTLERFSLGGAGVTAGSATLNFRGGTVYLGSGGINLTGTLTTLAINAQSGILGAKANWSTALPINLPSGGNIAFKAADAADAPYDITLAGALGGAGSLTKTGGGVLTLSAANAFSGSATVNAGTLRLTGSLSNANGALNVASGGTFAGTGSSAKPVHLQSGGRIAPDGLLTAASVTWDGGGTVALDLTADERLAVTGALTKGAAGAFTFDLSATAPLTAGVFHTLATFGSTTFTAADFTYTGLTDYLGAFVVAGDSVKFTAVPTGPGAAFNLWTVLEGLPAGQSGPADDGDGDGLPNVLEFALGLDPSAVDQPDIITTTIQHGGSAYPAFAYVRRADVGDAQVKAEISTTLDFTSTLPPVEVSSTPQSDGTVLVVVRSSATLAAEPNQFFRLVALLPTAQ